MATTRNPHQAPSSWDRHAEALRTVRFTDYSRLSPETRAATRASMRRVTAQMHALTSAFAQFGSALDRAGWAPGKHAAP